jgi:hypothetical protein
MNSPVLFLVFNRPDTTQQVFEAIRKAKPTKLFVAADGPRLGKEGEKEKCEAVKNIFTQIDWDCELTTLFRKDNLGCGKAVSEAITWFFEQVEEGIILEDDCLPDITFFAFCETMLKKYREETTVMHISGVNFSPPKYNNAYSYYFSSITYIWGWATWKRAWMKYDYKMLDYTLEYSEKILSKYFKDKHVKKYWHSVFKQIANKEIDTWDYQWHYCVLKNQSVSINPLINLVSNIGFGNGATHTVNDSLWYSNYPLQKYFSTKIFKRIKINKKMDDFHLKNIYQISADKNWIQRLYLKNKIKKISMFLNAILSNIKKYLKI